MKVEGIQPIDMVVVLPEQGCDLDRTLELVRVSLISQAMEKSGGDKAKAARLLNINRTTLVEKLRKRGMLFPKVATEPVESEQLEFDV